MSVDAKALADRLPSYLTRFVGREQEIAELEAMLEPRAGHHLRGRRPGQDPAAIEVARRLS
jgi:hypothetical protein